MKKKLAILACALITCFALAACSSDSVVYSGEYDESKYAQSSDISGVSFLMPKELFDAKEPAADRTNYQATELADHVFQTADEENYTLYQPGKFFLYVFDLGTIAGITDDHDVADIPALIGTSEWLTFADRNPKVYKSLTKNGQTQAVYGALITEKLTGYSANYNGYVTILHNEDTDHAYCLVVGYGDYDNDSTAKDIAYNFLLAE